MCVPVRERVYVCVGVNTGMHMLICDNIESVCVCAFVCVSPQPGERNGPADEHSHSGRPL